MIGTGVSKGALNRCMATVTKHVDIYDIYIESTTVPGLRLDVKCLRAEKRILMLLPNSNVKDLKKKLVN